MTALFLGIFGFGAVTVTACTAIVLYGMRIADVEISKVFDLTEGTLASLPAVIESLPESVQELLDDRRDASYTANLDVDVQLVSGDGRSGSYPALTIRNNGDRVVSFLTVRVAARNERGTPVAEWTEVVATPIGLCDEWRGPLFPQSTRFVVFRGWPRVELGGTGEITGVYEISDIRVANAEPSIAPTRVTAAP